MEEKSMNKIIRFIKGMIKQYSWIATFFSFIYTHLLGFNRIHGKNNNTIYLNKSFIKKTSIQIHGKNNIIHLSNQCLLSNCRITISGNNNLILLGENVSAVNCEIYIEDNNNTVSIGKESHISGTTHLACIEESQIIIGRQCLFSSEITFRTGDSHSILDLNGHRINPSENIIIGDHVWIGNKVILMKGTVIAQNSIVATGSVVTRKFEDTNVIIGGVPAKVIKQGINWDENRI